MTTTFEPATLPLEVKEDLCLQLLEEFGAQRIRVRRKSYEINCCCPLPSHQEKDPSASLNWEKLVFKCLGCDSQGGLMWFIATCRGVPGPAAREWLTDYSGLGAEFDLGAVLRVIDVIDSSTGARPPSVPIPRMSPRILDPWAKWVHPWLTLPPDGDPPGRGVPEENARALRVGYAERFPIGKGPDGGDRYSPRIVIPHFWRGSLVGWQSRRLDSTDGTPKYLSTGDFPKDRTIYDYDTSRRVALVVESPMSVLRHRHHLPIEATFGASVTDRQVQLLAEHDVVVLWMDNDAAGWRATIGHWDDDELPERKRTWVPGLIERLEPYSEVRVVEFPYAADPADVGDEEARAYFETAVPAALWRRPERLLCWLCRRHHAGKCP